MDLGRVGLKLRGFRFDGDGVAHRADFERDVDAGDAVDADRNGGLLEVPETLLADLQAVHASGQIGEIEMARRVGDRLARQAGAVVGDHDRSAGQGSARGIFDIAQRRSVEDLRGRVLRDQEDRDRDAQPQLTQPGGSSVCSGGHRHLPPFGRTTTEHRSRTRALSS
jgi:hypothetical protein